MEEEDDEEGGGGVGEDDSSPLDRKRGADNPSGSLPDFSS